MSIHAIRLRCEHLPNPLAIDVPQPRLQWRVAGTGQDLVQQGFRVEVEESLGDYRWDSGETTSDAQQVEWPAEDLPAFGRYRWRVRLWQDGEQPGAWSEWAEVGIGSRGNAPWQEAKWIRSAVPGVPNVPHLRRRFDIADSVQEARLYVACRGVFTPWLNGQRVDDEVFASGWTDYHQRQPYRCYDVTDAVQNGRNCVGLVVGRGWYAGRVGFINRHNCYGGSVEALVLLRMALTDGSVHWVRSDDAWESANGDILNSGFLDGEHVDAGLAIPNWCAADADAAGWALALARDFGDAPSIEAHPGPPVRETGTLAVQDHWQVRPGTTVFDFGQNFAGRVRLRLDLPAGTTLRLRHAEILTPDRSIYTDNLRSAASIDSYTCRGGGEVFEPQFTFHGFRYVEITGWPEPDPAAVTGVVLGSDCEMVGRFHCSDERVNQLQSNIQWTQRANYLEVPTDCPQRDERMGWTGDAQAYIRTAAYNADIAAFFTKWLVDLCDAQYEDGRFPNIAPAPTSANPGQDFRRGDAAWGDAGTICPWTIYQVYGDDRVLRQCYPAIQRFMAFIEDDLRDDLRTPRNDTGRKYTVFADWLNVDAVTSKDIIMTAFAAHSASLAAKIAEVLGEDADAASFKALSQRVRTAFCRTFLRDDGRILADDQTEVTQTAQLLGLHLDLVPNEQRTAVFEQLVAAIEARDHHLSTGFVGLPYLLPVLSREGRTDLAYQLLFTDTYPSWLYPVANGATSIWERWNGWTKEHGPGDPGMNSYSHYAYGACGEWFFSDIAGIDSLAPGYARIRVRPRITDKLSFAEAEYDSPRGLIASSWRHHDDAVELSVTVPPNCRAEIHLPTGDASAVLDGAVADDLIDGRIVCQCGSGVYRWRIATAALAPC